MNTINVITNDHKRDTVPSLAIMEIFSSIQGEGALMGMPVTFVRLQGCNLTCTFCDTKRSWAELKPNMSVMDILSKCKQDTVIITGGEPCMQDLTALIETLHLNDKFVAMETNGTLPIPDDLDWVACSPKAVANYEVHEGNAEKIGEYKFVVTDEFKYEDIPADIQALLPGRIWLQPNGDDMENMMKKSYKLAMEHSNLRSGIQLHKIMEVL